MAIKTGASRIRGGVEHMTNHPNRRRRLPFMSWWHHVNVELHARGCWSDSIWSETHWRYQERRTMTPSECAVAILKDRESVAQCEA